ncbi:MAG: methyltransferase family protein [Candidatus Kryptoniota bacterium]
MNPISVAQVVVFIIGTLFLLFISRNSLPHPEFHGFYRFFVFEISLLLVLLNVPFWTSNPFPFLQIISWILLLISIYLVVQSFSFLSKIGGSKERQKDSANFEFENTSKLVKVGIYKHIRHPMYASLLFLCLGAFLKNISVYSVLLTAIAVVFLVLTSKTEEKENIDFFGSSYIDYMKETKMFVPFTF